MFQSVQPTVISPLGINLDIVGLPANPIGHLAVGEFYKDTTGDVHQFCQGIVPYFATARMLVRLPWHPSKHIQPPKREPFAVLQGQIR